MLTTPTTRRRRGTIPLTVQVGTVAALFLAALATLAVTSLAVIGREGRRNVAERSLERAGAELGRRGRESLAGVPAWPGMSESAWGRLDRRLAAEAAAAIGPIEGVEGGYYVREGRRFVGTVGPGGGTGERVVPRLGQGPPPREYDLIRTQAEAAVAKGRAAFVVRVVPPSTVALRTAPVFDRPGGRVVGATWAMVRLVDPAYLGRSIRGYALAASLAMGGIALALVLTAGLVRSLRRSTVERRRLEAELRRSERLAALGKLLAGVAHEVRNPLAGIRGIAQLWGRGLERTDEALGHLIDEVDRLELIVSRLLQFSRADAQELAPGDLAAVVDEAARLAGPSAAESGVRVEVEHAGPLPAVAMAAPAVLQIFRNLTTNAIEAMPDGGVLRLSTRVVPRGGAVEATVADTGPGLPAEVVDHLFEPFFTTRPAGTGLGLAIAREIALAHRGDLRAEPGPGGVGAAFVLRLPVAADGTHEGRSR